MVRPCKITWGPSSDRWRARRGGKGVVESHRAYSEKFADPAALLSSQLENPLDSLTWTEARQRGGDSFTFKGIEFATRGTVLHWRTAQGR